MKWDWRVGALNLPPPSFNDPPTPVPGAGGNIVLGRDGHLKLSDFGLAKHFGVPLPPSSHHRTLSKFPHGMEVDGRDSGGGGC